MRSLIRSFQLLADGTNRHKDGEKKTFRRNCAQWIVVFSSNFSVFWLISYMFIYLVKCRRYKPGCLIPPRAGRRHSGQHAATPKSDGAFALIALIILTVIKQVFFAFLNKLVKCFILIFRTYTQTSLAALLFIFFQFVLFHMVFHAYTNGSTKSWLN